MEHKVKVKATGAIAVVYEAASGGYLSSDDLRTAYAREDVQIIEPVANYDRGQARMLAEYEKHK